MESSTDHVALNIEATSSQLDRFIMLGRGTPILQTRNSKLILSDAEWFLLFLLHRFVTYASS